MSEGRGKGPRPALGDVDLSDMPGPILQPDPEEVERRRTFARSLETPAFLQRSATAGMVKVVRPASPPVTAAPATSGISPPPLESIPKSHELPGAVDHSFPQGTLARRPRAEEPNLTVRLPEYVQQAVRMRAVREKTTVRLVVLRALQGAGFNVNDEDMTDDRGIVAKMRSRR